MANTACSAIAVSNAGRTYRPMVCRSASSQRPIGISQSHIDVQLNRPAGTPAQWSRMACGTTSDA